jgi:flagellar hook-associated protein 2
VSTSSTSEASTIASDLTIGTTSSGSGVISIPGLASGLNSAAIISEIISIDSQPMIQHEIEEAGVEAQTTQLEDIQNSLQTVITDAENLSGEGLFDTSQTATSSDPTLITATATSGATIGGYQVDVSQLATAASRTYTYTSPSSSDTITIDGQQVTIDSGTTLQDFADQINNDSSLDVEAAVTGTNQLVLSSTSTGQQTGSYIQVSDPGSSLSEITSDANAGQNATFTVNGTSGSSTSNTVTDAIPGVTLSLGGVTNSSSGSVTVVVSQPTVSTSSVTSAVNQFVSDYNTAVNAIETQLTTAPDSPAENTTEAQQGTLYNDQDLTDLLTSMRQLMYTAGSGLPSGMAALSDIGITTGAPSGSAAPSSSSLAGDLTVDTSTLDSAIQSNPTGVENVLASFSQAFTDLVSNEAGAGGVIAQRISYNDDQVTQMSEQITDMQNALTEQQTSLQKEYSALEASISSSDSTQSELESEIAQLTNSSSSSSS